MALIILKFFGFGFFWFALLFLASLTSTSHDSTSKTAYLNQRIFIGIPLILLAGYKVYDILKTDLSWSTEIIQFLGIVIVPLILAKLYITYGG